MRFALLCVVCSVWLFGVLGSCRPGKAVVQVSPGHVAIDSDSGQSGLFDLTAEWLVAWDEHIVPTDARAMKIGNGIAAIAFPSKFVRREGGNHIELARDGKATFWLTIVVPEALRNSTLNLLLPPISAHYRLFINGVEKIAQGQGQAGELRTRIVDDIQGGSQLSIVLQVTNSLGLRAGAAGKVLLGTHDAIRTYRERDLIQNFSIVGGLLLISIYFLLVFAIRPTEIATIALAAMYFSIALRMLTTGQINIYHFAPAIGADWTVRIAYLSPFGALAALFVYYSAYFRQAVPVRLSRGILWAMAVMASVVIFASPVFFTRFIMAFVFVIFAALALLTWIISRSVYLRLPHSRLIFFAGLAGLVCALHDAIVALRQSGDEMWIQYGVLTYALSMGVIYAQRVVQAIDEGNETKETLTRQVERRTRQLRDADKEREIAFKQMLIAKNEAEQANRAKSVFLANLSHEIRTPLNTIVGMSELLLDSPLTDEQRERIRVIRIGAEAQLTLINEILDFSKLAAHKLELDPHFCDLPQMLSDTVALIKPLVEKKHIGLMTEIASDLPRFVMCDANRLRQVLLNLLVNGVKFTNTGFVALRVDVQQRDEDAIQLLFSCVDTGIGLNTKDKENLFQPFQQADSSTTRKYGGTGLGLAISRQIVSLMGGELDVESEANFGARFFFSIRIGLASEKQVLATVTQNTGDAEPGRLFSHLRVLLVEDNEINMEIVQAMLQKLGLSADPAVNGQEAVEMAVTNRYDLILMDIQMPEMDGLAATKIIRSRRVTTRIVALTANTSETDQADYLAAGMNAFLPKPVTMRGLTQLLTNLTAQ